MQISHCGSPDFGLMIAQDLADNKVRLFTAANLKNWITILKHLKSMTAYDTILVGHGEPTDKSVFAASIAYLNETLAVLKSASDAQSFANQLAKKFPDYRGGLHQLTGSILLPEK